MRLALKTHVKAHDRVDPRTGKVEHVSDYDDSRARRQAPTSFRVQSRPSGDGVHHGIMVGREKAGHVSGFERDDAFHIYRTEMDAEHRGSGLFQRAIQHVANRYPKGAYVHQWESSTALKRALEKLGTVEHDEQAQKIWVRPSLTTKTLPVSKPALYRAHMAESPSWTQRAIGVLLSLKKSIVHAHQRTTKEGQVVQAKEYQDKRTKRPEDPHAVRSAPKAAKPSPAHDDSDPYAFDDDEGPVKADPAVERKKQAHSPDDDLSWFEGDQEGGDVPGHDFTPTPHPTSEDQVPAWLEAVMQDKDIADAVQFNMNARSSHLIYQNPDGSYKPERQQVHQAIVASMLNPKAVAEPGKKPHAVILMGPPGAGKTSTLAPMVKEYGVEFTTVNADDVKAKLPGYNGRNAGVLHEESSDIAEGQLFPQALSARHNLVMDITGSNGQKVKKMVEGFHARGYEISIAYAHLPAWKAATRAVDRFRSSGRFVPPTYIVNKVADNPEKTYNELKNDSRVSHWRKYDTDVPKGAAAPLRERDEPLTKSIHRRDVGEGRREPNGSDFERLNPTLRRAHRFRADLVKSLVYLDDDLSSPDLDPTSRGVLLAERYRLITQLDTLDTKLREVAHAS